MISTALAIKLGILALFVLSALIVHLRGRVRLPFHRQVFNHSTLLAPYNVLAYLFSAVPRTPILPVRDFTALEPLQANWKIIRDEALSLFDAGHIRAAEKNNDASFNSFFKQGWKRFYLKWYGEPLPSAQQLCPRTVELVNAIPSVKAALFALLPPGGKLNPHRDPFAGSLRYHLGLVTPNSDACRIFIDGQPYAWRDGEDIVFDETYIHSAENRTDITRIILFCDIERPLRTGLVRAINRGVGGFLGRATAAQNVSTDRIGAVNRAYGGIHAIKQVAKRAKQANRTIYKVVQALLILGALALLVFW
ncbi:MAG: aspartyl/asparaginyl beta-hydroxylase domain-containing protein [Lysobacteraceae bacterium]